ncbi:MAG TPA: two-component regulator propeller domain-containing protein, partial [Cyclobacteriaceae bacterium]|nr:two-component regulator propeller domain-containing protein [Cyclobacteriaceae bacterium]
MKYIICLSLYFGLHFVCYAQNENLRFKHLSVQDGLSRSWVKCFLQDRSGLLWIGTGDGLNKFDGNNFTVYKYLPTQAKSLNHNNTNVIFEDSKGQLWVGTQAGLNYYQRELDEFVPVPFVNNYVTSLYELHNDTLLVATAGGLCLFNKVSQTSRC